MNKTTGALLAALLLIFLPATSQAAPKKAASRQIRFQGAPQYTQQELQTAAGLNPVPARLSPTELKARAKQLNDTGMFAAVKLNADSRGIVFTLTPASQLYPIHLDNLPLLPGQAIEEQLHQRVPLYRGQLPAAGSVVDSACAALEELLTARGIHATVKAALTSGLGPKKMTALNFSITAPAVRIGALQLSGVSAAMQAKAATLVNAQSGSPFDTENTAAGLEHAFLDLYQDQGYLAATVHVTAIDPPSVSADAIDISYRIDLHEGAIYKFGAIRYPADAPLPRMAVEKFLTRYPAGSGRPLDLFLAALRDAFHAKGYLDCAATAQPVFNEAAHSADYALQITPGPVYHLAAVHFDGAPDALLARLQKVWTMAPGDLFDESYAQGFSALAQKKDKPLAKWLPTVLTTVEVKTDADKQQVDCTLHFAKLPQTGR